MSQQYLEQLQGEAIIRGKKAIIFSNGPMHFIKSDLLHKYKSLKELKQFIKKSSKLKFNLDTYFDKLKSMSFNGIENHKSFEEIESDFLNITHNAIFKGIKNFKGEMINAYMKIMFLPSLNGGGAEKMVLKIANGFSKKNINVNLILVNKEGAYLRDLSKKVKLTSLNSSSLYKSIPNLIIHMLKSKPDILITAMTHVNVVSLIVKKILFFLHFKLIISERNDFRYEKFTKINIKDRILRFMAKILYQHADHIIAISDGVKRSLIDQINLTENKITTIYNPIYNNKISKLSLCKMPHPWFNLKSYKVILGVGRLTHQKGFDTLIKSFSILNKKIKCKLIILGEGELRDELQKLISKYKVDRHVCLPGV